MCNVVGGEGADTTNVGALNVCMWSCMLCRDGLSILVAGVLG